MKKNIMNKNFFEVIIFIVLLLLSMFSVYRLTRSDVDSVYDITKLNLSDVNKVMIVAHPDDEVLFGGAHLIQDKYLVICVTCGTSKKRSLEFKKAMKITNDEYLMLGYPDKVDGNVSDWSNSIDDIYNNLEYIINYKDWGTVVTHNPDGEYGHIHHRLLSSMVTEISDHNKLVYFEKYYTKRKLKKVYMKLDKIDNDLLERKSKILTNVYKSQRTTITHLGHIVPYENFIQYKDWSN